MLIYLMAIWIILQTFAMFDAHLVYFELILYIFPAFGVMYQDKSGNPVQ
jgi:hypothetical protein